MKIDSYNFGQIIIDGKSYDKDLIIFPSRVESGWWRKEGHRLYMSDLRRVLEAKPEVLVVGTGYYGEMSIPDETRKHVESKGIELIGQKTAEARKTFHHLAESKKAMAVLHLTC